MHNMYLLTTNFDEILFRILRQVSLKKKKTKIGLTAREVNKY